MKAFLSHSSKDKHLVGQVARALGRQYCLYDEHCFDTGRDFCDSIVKGLDETSVFVLFASQNALGSFWVDFEQEEAFRRKIERKLKSALVFVVDGQVRPANLPDWLRRGKIVSQASAKAIAREIRSHIDDLLREERKPFFLGRSSELRELEHQLLPIDGSIPPRVIALWGLDGIGRRSVCERVARDVLNLKRLLVIRVEDGDSLAEIVAKLSDQLEPYAGDEELRHLVQVVQESSETELIQRLRRLLKTAIVNRELPVFLDTGNGLLDEGHPKPHLLSLLGSVEADAETYIGVVTYRRPLLPDQNDRRIAIVRVGPLPSEETSRLIVSLASRQSVQFGTAEISELSQYVAGYPPAAYFAIQVALQYGKTSVLVNKSRLVDFRAESFVRYLSRSVKLSEVRKQILRYLAVYSPLPLPVLGEVIGLDAKNMLDEIEYLIDSSLVVPDNLGWYRLAHPVVDAIGRVTGHLDVEHNKVAHLVKGYLKETQDDEGARLELSRVCYRAFVRAGLEGHEELVHLRTDLIKTLKDFYHAREYDIAVKWGMIAVDAQHDSVTARDYLTRALIHEEKYSEARDQISALRSLGRHSVAAYLSGFLERKLHHHEAAIAYYEEALREGRQGVAVHRELALCFASINKFEEAQRHLLTALQVEPDNRFVVDLQIWMATKLRDERLARAKLQILKGIEKESFYYHRLSTLEDALGNREAALDAARLAVQSERRPTFEMLSQLSKCQIDSGLYDGAVETIRSIERLYGGIRKDIRLGLQCKLEIRRGNYEEALSLWMQLYDKHLPVHIALRLDILRGLLGTSTLSVDRREGYKREVDRLAKQLEGVSEQERVVSFGWNSF